MSLTAYYDSLTEARWFRALSPLLRTVAIQKLAGRGANPPVVDDLIRYDRPDIILLNENNPVLVIEKTREVPTGHNVGQRIARLVRAVEQQVPTIKFFPFDAMKHGDYAGTCNCNIRIIKAFERMSQIHNVPILAVNWPCDQYSELIDDGTEDTQMKAIVDNYLRSGLNATCAEINRAKTIMQTEYAQRLRRRPSYASAPPSVEIVPTARVVSSFGTMMSGSLKNALLAREESLVYEIGMLPSACRREDPYTGTQFIYDYIWCRNGPRVEDKSRNLILHFPKIRHAHWMACNPNDPSRKSSNWYLTANAMVFVDSVLPVRN